jgi:signal transduction histidine kinase
VGHEPLRVTATCRERRQLLADPAGHPSGLRHGVEVELLVSDLGNGNPEMHDRVFERFVRVQDRPRPARPSTWRGTLRGRGAVKLVTRCSGEGSVFAGALRHGP